MIIIIYIVLLLIPYVKMGTGILTFRLYFDMEICSEPFHAPLLFISCLVNRYPGSLHRLDLHSLCPKGGGAFHCHRLLPVDAGLAGAHTGRCHPLPVRAALSFP